MVEQSATNEIFMQAGAEIDHTLAALVTRRASAIGSAGVIDIYRKLAVSMAFNTASVIMTLATDEAEGRRAVEQMAELLPMLVNEGLERAIALGLEARRINPNFNHG